MKTFFFDTLNRYKRFSEKLDAKTILCNKSWWIFNDSGEKEIYIFQEDGSLIISFNGKVTHATWQYIPANKSLVISTSKESYMLHPAFVDENIFALQQDGTNKFAFMIDESQKSNFAPKSLRELTHYFEEKEVKRIQEEERQQQLYIEATRQRKIEQKENQRIELLKGIAEESWERNKDKILINDKGYIRSQKYSKDTFYGTLVCGIAAIIGVCSILILWWGKLYTIPTWGYVLGFCAFTGLIGFPISIILSSIICKGYFASDYDKKKNQYINDYIEKKLRGN